MYKLLVVDDEFNIRDGLVNTIPWSEIGVEVVGTADDGEDAYEKIKALSPDIVITDVNMDNLNGLDLTELIRQNYPFIKVIILSGYDNFEFVSRALELKVFSYIIKPVCSDELISAVHKVILEIEEEKELKEKIHLMESEIDHNKPLLVEKLLYDLLNGAIIDSNEFELRKNFLDIHFNRKYYTCVIMAVADHHEIIRDSGMRKLQSLLFGIREILYNDMSDYELWPLAGGSDSLFLLVGNDSVNADEFRKKCTAKLEQLLEDISKHLNITATITIGGIYNNILDIPRSFREATLASEYNAISSKSSIIYINDILVSNGGHYIYSADFENLLLSSLTEQNEQRSSVIIKALFDRMEYQTYSKNQMRVDITSLLSSVARRAMELGVDIYQIFSHESLDPYTALEHYNTRDQIEKWLKNIVARTIREIKNQLASNVKCVIVRAKEFLKDNYLNPNLSLADISNHVFLNASYFCRLYKKETGENYVETLTRLRLDRAKTLLKESNRKISDICEETGYLNTKYFCSLFKKHFGFTPLEYRKS